MGEIVGLNYQSVSFLLSLYRVKNRKKIFEDLQLIEQGALNYLAKQRKKE